MSLNYKTTLIIVAILREDYKLTSNHVPKYFYVEPTYWSSNPYVPNITHNFSINSSEGGAELAFNLYVNYPSANTVLKIIKIEDAGYEYDFRTFLGESSVIYWLPNGNYKIEVYRGNSTLSAADGTWIEGVFPTEHIDRYNDFFIQNNNNAGGIRVREIHDHDYNSQITNKTEYSYNLFSNQTLTSGMLTSPIRVLHKGGCGTPIRSCSYYRLAGYSFYPLSNEGGGYVVYPEVRTKQTGKGRIDRTYTFAFDVAPSDVDIDQVPLIPPPDMSWRRNRLHKEQFYNEEGQLLKEDVYVDNFYSEDSSSYFNYFAQISYKVRGHRSPEGYFECCWNKFSLSSKFTGIRKKIERSYNLNSDIVSEVLTEYDYFIDKGYPVLKEKTMTASDGSLVKTAYRYAFNDLSDFFLPMVNSEIAVKDSLDIRHYWQPLEVFTTKQFGDSPVMLLDGTKHSFNYFNDMLFLGNVKEYSSINNYITTDYVNSNKYGFPTEVVRNNLPPTAYLWGYNNQQLLAIIEGVNYSDVVNALGQSVIDELNSTTLSVGSIQNILSNLRNHTNMGTSKITSYTYKALVGMVCKMDPRGIAENYEYDNFNRLKFVKDHEGNIIKAYSYSYR